MYFGSCVINPPSSRSMRHNYANCSLFLFGLLREGEEKTNALEEGKAIDSDRFERKIISSRFLSFFFLSLFRSFFLSFFRCAKM